MVDLVRADFLSNTRIVRGIRQTPILQAQERVALASVAVNVVIALSIKPRFAVFDAVHRVSFCKQKLGKIRPILPFNTFDL